MARSKVEKAFNICAVLTFALSFMVVAFVWGYVVSEMFKMINN